MRLPTFTTEEHPRGSRSYRLRMRVGGRLKTLLSGMPVADRDELTEIPRGREVYFIQRGDLLVKIGWSDDAPARLRTLRQNVLEPLTLLATVPGGAATERMFHAAFRGYQYQGEWFHYCADLRAFIWKLRQIEAFRPREAA